MSIQLQAISKRFGDAPVVSSIDLAIATGELFVLLGASGSGKSTLLRIVAGLTEPDSGRVFLAGRDATEVDPRHRGVGFVFQHYALFRHLTVAENVEFPLRVQKVGAQERRLRREELLELVALGGLGGRRPGQLSGGQQQRVALARALAGRPQVLLLDEPFGALDAQIRAELRHTLRRIQRELGVTTVFVTHDQEEAFALADRLAVLGHGRLLEVGKPEDLYSHPRHELVASFLGAANLLVGEATETGVRLGEVEVPLGVEAAARGRRVRVLFRPEDVELAAGVPRSPRLGRAVVVEATFAGAFERLRLRLPRPPAVRAISPPSAFGADYLEVDAVRPQHESRRLPLVQGDEVEVGVRHVHVLAPATLRLARLATGVEDPAAPSPATLFAQALAAALPAELAILLGGRQDGEDFDVAVLDLEPGATAVDAAAAAENADHLLFVPAWQGNLPRRLLVCVAVGEPGKADVSFAERLAWRLGAAVTVLTVLPEPTETPPAHVSRFLDAAERALSGRGGEVTVRVRRGAPLAEIRQEIEEQGHDLLLVGAPLPVAGEPLVQGLVARLLAGPPSCPVLVVRPPRQERAPVTSRS